MSPRYRWIKLYTIAYLIAASISATVLFVMRYNDPAKYREPIGILNILGLVAVYAVFYVVLFFVVGIPFANSQFVIQSELDEYKEQQARARNFQPGKDFPGVTVIPEYSAPTDGPGRYRVEGVNRNTKDDTAIEVEAESAANAKVKAELDGIVVTTVTKTAEKGSAALDQPFEYGS